MEGCSRGNHTIIFAYLLPMMKAAVLTECGSPLEIQQVPIPQPGPKDILVKLIVCGVCHSDLHGARGGQCG